MRIRFLLVLIDPILRTNPNVGKIYVLIKAKDNEAAMKRLKNEVEDTELFRCLLEIHGKNYHNFVLSKQVPVVGNFREANIGIAPEIAKEIAEEVDVIINSVANTTFDERYDVALDINTVGPFWIMSFTQRFRRLKIFLQVSTAYVNGQRQGLILEKPFCLGDTITKGIGSSDFSTHRNIVLDIEAEIKLAFDSRRHSFASASVTQEMKELGSREKTRSMMGGSHPSGLNLGVLRAETEKEGEVTGGDRRRIRRWRWCRRARGTFPHRWVVDLAAGVHHSDGDVDYGGRRLQVMLDLVGEAFNRQIDVRDT
ncbi:fatty acyl-CoA reductase 2, chloroplastic-like [Aegilops tauschii subsp. strangulata]|uniref:fatty acyl-CoA reductase 2, chloroplastic-like n=1 Tax=Aegilops tauschii subsp. strangulata TaxID=200361 RepID=UPI003CC8A959